MYQLKQVPEDFIVKEISNLELKDNGNFAIYKLTKRNRNTLDVIKEISKRLNLPDKKIGFAGSKDKNAVTEQLISIPKVNKKKLEVINNIDNIKLEFKGYTNNPITLGDLKGNKFEIVIRDLDENSKIQINKTEWIENYFDEQRFSINNVEIGRNLILKNFAEAVKLIDNPKVQESLNKNSKDSVGALKKLPLRMLKFYVHAYQSFIWNKTVAELLFSYTNDIKKVKYSQGELIFAEDNLDESIIKAEAPLIGFDYENLIQEIKDEEFKLKLKQVISKIMQKENISSSDFVIKQIPELTMEGEFRSLYQKVEHLEINKAENDELNQGKQKIKVSFSLGKGSYATMVVRKLLA